VPENRFLFESDTGIVVNFQRKTSENPDAPPIRVNRRGGTRKHLSSTRKRDRTEFLVGTSLFYFLAYGREEKFSRSLYGYL
jgi:hypothetical protein